MAKNWTKDVNSILSLWVAVFVFIFRQWWPVFLRLPAEMCATKFAALWIGCSWFGSVGPLTFVRYLPSLSLQLPTNQKWHNSVCTLHKLQNQPRFTSWKLECCFRFVSVSENRSVFSIGYSYTHFAQIHYQIMLRHSHKAHPESHVVWRCFIRCTTSLYRGSYM